MPIDSRTMRVVHRGRRRRVEDVELLPVDQSFLDLLSVLPTLSVAEVTELIESGEADIDKVIEAERLGKMRKTVLALVKSDSGKVYPVFSKNSVG